MGSASWHIGRRRTSWTGHPKRRMERGHGGYKHGYQAFNSGRPQPSAPGSEMLMPSANPSQQGPLFGAAAVLLLVVALVLRRRKRSRRAGGTEPIANAAEQARGAGGHALGKAASAARDLVSEAAGLVGDRHLDETLDRLQSALDEARSAAAAALHKAQPARH